MSHSTAPYEIIGIIESNFYGDSYHSLETPKKGSKLCTDFFKKGSFGWSLVADWSHSKKTAEQRLYRNCWRRRLGKLIWKKDFEYKPGFLPPSPAWLDFCPAAFQTPKSKNVSTVLFEMLLEMVCLLSKNQVIYEGSVNGPSQYMLLFKRNSAASAQEEKGPTRHKNGNTGAVAANSLKGKSPASHCFSSTGDVRNSRETNEKCCRQQLYDQASTV